MFLQKKWNYTSAWLMPLYYILALTLQQSFQVLQPWSPYYTMKIGLQLTISSLKVHNFTSFLPMQHPFSSVSCKHGALLTESIELLSS